MQLDPRPFAMVLVVLALLLIFLSIGAWWTRRTSPGFTRWTVANLLLVLCLALLLLRPVAPDWISVVAANILMVASSISLLEGTREFRGLPPRVWAAYAAGALAILALMYFDYV